MATATLQQGSDALQTGQHLIGGRYRTHTRLGKGRLGEIFAAIDERFEKLGVEQHVAVQVIPQNIVGNNKLFNKLSLGYTMLKAGAHPNIVDYLQFGRDDRFGFLAMEYLDGASLAVLLEDVESLPLEEVKPVIRSIGSALSLLHAKSMVHGNLTTSNVFIANNLEVRLLDVVPLGSDSAIFRGATVCESFGRCTVQDDVFGLACLAYEMLSGRHPFNYSPPSEARLAGLRVDRIASLTDDEWHALRLALSFDEGQRMSSVAEFMRAFGIVGTERLRPAVDEPGDDEIEQPSVAEYEPGVAPAVAVTPVATAPESFAPVQRPMTTLPEVDADPVDWLDDELPGTAPERKAKHPVRTTFLAMVLVGLVAWAYFGQPQESITRVIDYVDNRIIPESAAPGLESGELQVPDPAPAIAPDIAAPATRSTVNEPAASDVAAVTDAAEPATTVIEGNDPIAEQAEDRSPAAAPETIESNVESVDESADEIPNEVLADAPAESDNITDSRPEPENVAIEAAPPLPTFEPVVSVSEGSAAARIIAPQDTNQSAPLVWWTSDITAVAEQDYIPVTQRAMPDGSAEDSNVLHISLINDGLPEPEKAFFVNFGRQNVGQGNIEHVASVRVNIIDDDTP